MGGWVKNAHDYPASIASTIRWKEYDGTKYGGLPLSVIVLRAARPSFYCRPTLLDAPLAVTGASTPRSRSTRAQRPTAVPMLRLKIDQRS